MGTLCVGRLGTFGSVSVSNSNVSVDSNAHIKAVPGYDGGALIAFGLSATLAKPMPILKW